jgi:threonine synthase
LTAPTWQLCDGCGRRYAEFATEVRCGDCDGLLSVHHQPPAITGAALRALFDGRCRVSGPAPETSGVWRFREMVLPDALDAVVSQPEGNTPLLTRTSLGAWCDAPELRIKHEGHNPTGSFKDRGMTVAVTQARRIGASAVACASTGNTSASLAAYAALAGLPGLTFVPEGQVALGKLTQTLAYGARTLLVDGDFDACLRLVQEASEKLDVYLVNSINPFRIEGQKTIVFEMLQQLEWQAPDWIVLPAGNLGNVSAFGKALHEALAVGLIDRLPRLAAIQAEGASPFAAAFSRGFDRLEPVIAHTIATAIKIGAPASYHRGVGAIRGTSGVVTSVSDREILEAKVAIDRAGVGCEPASAASLAGVRQLRGQGIIGKGEVVVAVLTGHLLKDPGILQRIHEQSETGLPAGNPPIRIPPTIEAVRRVIEDWNPS